MDIHEFHGINADKLSAPEDNKIIRSDLIFERKVWPYTIEFTMRNLRLVSRSNMQFRENLRLVDASLSICLILVYLSSRRKRDVRGIGIAGALLNNGGPKIKFHLILGPILRGALRAKKVTYMKI